MERGVHAWGEAGKGERGGFAREGDAGVMGIIRVYFLGIYWVSRRFWEILLGVAWVGEEGGGIGSGDRSKGKGRWVGSNFKGVGPGS